MKKCPYCNVELEKIPQRKKKCPNCGDYIWVRTLYKGGKSKGKLLLTEEQAKEFDKEKRRFYDRENWIKRLYHFDVTEQEFDSETDNLKKQFGFNPPYADVAWRILNNRIGLYGQKSDYHKLSSVYHEMAKITYQENKPFQHFLEEACRYYLLTEKDVDSYGKLIVLNCNDGLVCPKCRELEGKRFTYQEAFEKKILPVLDCENTEEGKGAGKGFCRCWYAVEVDL